MEVFRCPIGARSDHRPPPLAAGAVPRGAAFAIGNFDGVHAGHRALIDLARTRAAALGVPALALTFEPHPAALVHADGAPPLLTPLDRKLALLEEAGIDAVVVVDFTPELAALDPDAFAAEVLVRTLGAREVIVGTEFRFGQGRRGDVPTLRTSGAHLGFEVHGVPPVLVDGEVASSSRARALITTGDVAAAARLLGRPHDVDGTVVRGAGRGRTIGLPTANVAISGVILPAPGVYAGWAQPRDAGGPRRVAAVNLGHVPTFGGTTLTLEAHLLDFEGDLYGSTLRVAFAERLRGEATFPDASALVAQIRRDVDAARALLQVRP